MDPARELCLDDPGNLQARDLGAAARQVPGRTRTIQDKAIIRNFLPVTTGRPARRMEVGGFDAGLPVVMVVVADIAG